MKLSADMIELLREVKARMLADAECGREKLREYICWNVWLAHHNLSEIPRAQLWETTLEREQNREIVALIVAIEESLDGCETFGTWFDRETDGIEWSFPDYRYVYTLGRLAWLDKMIETGEIA